MTTRPLSERHAFALAQLLNAGWLCRTVETPTGLEACPQTLREAARAYAAVADEVDGRETREAVGDFVYGHAKRIAEQHDGCTDDETVRDFAVEVHDILNNLRADENGEVYDGRRGHGVPTGPNGPTHDCEEAINEVGAALGCNPGEDVVDAAKSVRAMAAPTPPPAVATPGLSDEEQAARARLAAKGIDADAEWRRLLMGLGVNAGIDAASAIMSDSYSLVLLPEEKSRARSMALDAIGGATPAPDGRDANGFTLPGVCPFSLVDGFARCDICEERMDPGSISIHVCTPRGADADERDRVYRAADDGLMQRTRYAAQASGSRWISGQWRATAHRCGLWAIANLVTSRLTASWQAERAGLVARIDGLKADIDAVAASLGVETTRPAILRTIERVRVDIKRKDREWGDARRVVKERDSARTALRMAEEHNALLVKERDAWQTATGCATPAGVRVLTDWALRDAFAQPDILVAVTLDDCRRALGYAGTILPAAKAEPPRVGEVVWVGSDAAGWYATMGMLRIVVEVCGDAGGLRRATVWQERGDRGRLKLHCEDFHHLTENAKSAAVAFALSLNGATPSPVRPPDAEGFDFPALTEWMDGDEPGERIADVGQVSAWTRDDGQWSYGVHGTAPDEPAARATVERLHRLVTTPSPASKADGGRARLGGAKEGRAVRDFAALAAEARRVADAFRAVNADVGDVTLTLTIGELDAVIARLGAPVLTAAALADAMVKAQADADHTGCNLAGADILRHLAGPVVAPDRAEALIAAQYDLTGVVAAEMGVGEGDWYSWGEWCRVHRNSRYIQVEAMRRALASLPANGAVKP
jgi:hypothetical protein